MNFAFQNTDESLRTLKRQVSEYAISEDMGVSLLTQMLDFVPGAEERSFLDGQIEDEKKHNRLFAQRAEELGVEEQFFQDGLQKLYVFGQQCVDKKDWLLCVACQSVIEELAYASFNVFFQHADKKTQIILEEVIGDEKRHLEFALWQIGKWMKTEEDRQKIMVLQQQVLQIFLDSLESKRAAEQFTPVEFASLKKVLKHTYVMHKNRFAKLGLKVPDIPIQYLTSLA